MECEGHSRPCEGAHSKPKRPLACRHACRARRGQHTKAQQGFPSSSRGVSREAAASLLLNLPCAQVVHARLQPLLPGVEVQGGELAKVGVRHEHIEALALVDVGTTVRSHVHQGALLDLPHSLVQSLQVVWNVQVLDAAIGCHLRRGMVHMAYKCMRGVRVQAQAVQVMQQVLVDDGELARQHTAHIDVGGVGLQGGKAVQAS
eukprot:1159294-Pelagomonas_calceolata.AAC.3